MARPRPLPATQLSLFKVTRNATTGNPVIQSTGTPVTVPSYTVPLERAPDGVRQRARHHGRPADTRVWRRWIPRTATSSRSGRSTPIDVGGRAAVRWYEIDPTAASLLQSGTASSASRFQFNGAISPNRQVNGTTQTGGNAMVLNFDSSSITTFPRDQDGVQDRSRRAVQCRSWSRTRQGRCPGSIAICRHSSAAGAITPPRLPTRQCEPGLAGQPVRRRLGKRRHRPGDLEDPELRRYSLSEVLSHSSAGSAAARAPARVRCRLMPGEREGIDDLTRWLGLRWEAHDRVRLTIRPELINPAGLLAGPVAYAMVDYSMGSTLWRDRAEGEAVATIGISINYVQTARAGDVDLHVATGSPQRPGGDPAERGSPRGRQAAGDRHRQLRDLPQRAAGRPPARLAHARA